MLYTNEELYLILNNLNEQIFSQTDLIFPVKINFYIQKNKNLLIPLVQEIEDTRIKIVSANGILNEETNQYSIDPDKMPIVIDELNKLFAIQQEVNFYQCELKDLGDVPLTMQQMDALMFMIKE